MLIFERGEGSVEMSEKYQLTLQKEILVEAAADVSAGLYRYIRKNAIA